MKNFCESLKENLPDTFTDFWCEATFEEGTPIYRGTVINPVGVKQYFACLRSYQNQSVESILRRLTEYENEASSVAGTAKTTSA